MSRAERRAYKRMTKNQDPYALPVSSGQRAKVERQRARRRARGDGEFRFVSGRFLVWALGGGGAAALIAFSLAWPSMPLAAIAGIAAALIWIGLVTLLRAAQARAAARR